MKSHRKHQNKINSIATDRWTAYAAAAAATGFAAAQTAEATIHYSSLIEYPFHGKKEQDKEFRFLGSSALFFKRTINYTGTHTFSYNGANDHFAIEAQNGSVAGFFYTCAFTTSVASVSNLGKGDVISQRPFAPDGGILMTADGLGCGGGARGQFFLPGTGFIGFKFDRGQGAQYGWARIKKGFYPGNQYELVDYAYADPGEPINAAQKNSGQAERPVEGSNRDMADIVLDSGSLGLLALGHLGLQAWRGGRVAGL